MVVESHCEDGIYVDVNDARTFGSQERIADFGNPPVVETVLSVQFAPLKGFTSAHFGWFWKSYLDDSWTKAEEAPYLPDQFEKFETERRRFGAPRFSVRRAPSPERMLFIHENDDRVVQIQNTRFLYNWRRRDGDYPKHEQRLKDFHALFDAFRGFVIDAELGSVDPNQWEVTYVNHVPRGELWQTPRDWHGVLPSLLSDWTGCSGTQLESYSAEWRHEIEPKRGRLHVALRHRELPPPNSTELLVLELTARGPITDESGFDLDSGFGYGRQAIVETFVAMTSETVRRTHWKQVT